MYLLSVELAERFPTLMLQIFCLQAHAVAQGPGSPIDFILALIIFSGLGISLILFIAALIIVYGSRRRIRRRAADAGTTVTFKSVGPSMDMFDECEGCAYCIIAMIVVVLAAFGVTFPIQLIQPVENLLLFGVMVFMAVLFGFICPALVIFGTYIDLRSQNKALEIALKETAHREKVQVDQPPGNCPYCSAPLQGNERFCSNCGAAVRED